MNLRFTLVQIPPKWIAAIFGVVGVVLVGVSARTASERVGQLRSWPSVDAHVDGGQVVSMSGQGNRQAMYAGRLDLRYDFRNQRYAVPVTEEVYSSFYAGEARGVQQAVRDGRVNVLLDPAQPSAPVLNAGYNAEFFFNSMIFGFIGFVFTFLAAVFWRVLRDEAPGTVKKRSSGSSGARWVAAFFTLLGSGFVAGGVFAFWAAQRESSTWKPVDARVDSTDVVWRRSSGSSNSARVDLYAPRAWITYRFANSAYHVPVVRGAYSNDSSGAADAAVSLYQTGRMSARVNPSNPFDAALKRPGAVLRFWFPALFFVPGAVCLLGVWVVMRKKRRRRPRRRAAKKAVPSAA